ncbi:MAG TPA: hypothetical protein VN794_21845 [Methylomirabilota bacterium]|nr:hypothetical protein [Methylomirabilota bacterium]
MQPFILYALLLVAAFLVLATPALRDKLYMREDVRHTLKPLAFLASEWGMAYAGTQKTGQGTPVPYLSNGNIDINALVGQLVDQRKDYVYDTLKLAPGTTVTSQPYRMFQVPIGAADPYNGGITKTEQETNMRSAGFFSPPYDFILNNLGFYFLIGAQLFDIQTIMNMGWFEFKILQKQQFMGHFQRHPSGMGVTGMTTATNQQNWLNGLADPKACWQFGDWRKYIPPQVNFSLNINFTETYQQYYNASAASSLPSAINTELFASGVLSSVATLPTLLPQSRGGNGIQLLCIMNGISNGPVQ